MLYDSREISKELQDYKLDELLAQKRRQQLRANSHELRQLERHIQLAIISKQLKDQLQNVASLKEQELYKKREDDRKFKIQYEEIRSSMQQKEEQERQKKKDLLEMLKCQMKLLQKARQKKFQNVEKDRDDMERLTKQIEAEEIAKRKRTELYRKKYREEMSELFLDMKLKKQQEKERDIKETERILEYQAECDNFKLQLLLEMERVRKEKECLIEHVGQQLAAENKEKEKRENLFLSLFAMERKEKDDELFRENLVKQINERDKLRSEIEKNQREIQTKREIQFKEEEAKFRQEYMRSLEERDKVDQLSDEKRRRKKMEHNNALREMIEKRRYQHANKIVERIANYDKMISDGKKRDQLIEDERIFMLSTVPKDLLRYLPPNILKSAGKDL